MYNPLIVGGSPGVYCTSVLVTLLQKRMYCDESHTVTPSHFYFDVSPCFLALLSIHYFGGVAVMGVGSREGVISIGVDHACPSS